jgi:hypothetical protein
MTDVTKYEVWERGQLIDTFTSEKAAIHSAEQYGDEDTEVIMIVRSGTCRSTTKIYPELGVTRETHV